MADITIAGQKPLPDYAVPVQRTDLPDYAVPVKPPQEQAAPEDTGPSPIRQAFDWANKPLLDLTSPAMRKNLELQGQPTLADAEDPNWARLKGFTSGAIQGGLDFASGLTSPLSLGLMGTGGLASGAAKYGVPALAQILRMPGIAAGAGMVGHGLYNAYNEPDWIRKLGGIAEAAMGGAGAAHLYEAGRPPIIGGTPPGGLPGDVSPIDVTPPKPILDPTRRLGTGRVFEQGPSSQRPVRGLLGPGRVFERGPSPLGSDINLPAEFTAVGDEPPYVPPKQPGVTEASRFNMARERQLRKSEELQKEKKPKIKDYWITDAKGVQRVNPKYQNFTEPERIDITKGFGGSGHPESPEYVQKVLDTAAKGTPGLSVEKMDNGHRVVYRSPNGNPIGVAKVVYDSKGTPLVQDLALNKKTGLLSGRAAVAIGDKLQELGATEAAGTISEDARNFLNKMNARNLKKSEPQLMQVPGSTNIAMGGASPRVLDVVGTALYAKSNSGTTIKELLQNTFDEHRIIGQTKPVSVVLSSSMRDGVHSKELTVRDYGRGMTPDQLYTKFTDLGETGKAGEEGASGGFGFAKAAPMLGGRYFKAESIIKDPNTGRNVKYVFEGTPSQLKKQDVGVKLYGTPTTEPTGLKVTTTFRPKDYAWDVKDLARQYTENSTSITSPVHYIETYDNINNNQELQKFINDPNYVPRGETVAKFEKQPQDPIQDTIETPGATINIHHVDKPNSTANQYDLNVLNKGLYQATHRKSYGQNLDNVPARIGADIIAKVEEGEDDYPFTTDRAQLSDTVSDAIDKWVQDNIVSGAHTKKKNELIATYNALADVKVSGTIRKPVFWDPGGKLTPDEKQEFLNNPKTHEMIRFFDKVIDDIVKAVDAEYGNTERSDRLEGVGLFTSNDNIWGIHVPNPANPNKSTIMINPFATFGKTPASSSWMNMVTAMHEAAHISTKTPRKLGTSFVGLNDPRVGEFMQELLKETGEQGGLNAAHGIEFIKRLAEVFTVYGPENAFKASDQLESIVSDKSGGYDGQIQKLLQIYKDSRGRTATTDDSLSATGVHAKSPTSGAEGAGSGNKPNGERVPSAEVLDKLREGLKNAGVKRGEQEKLYSAERAKRIQAAVKADTGGLQGFYKQLHELKGELPKVDFERTKLKHSDVNDLIDAVKNSPYLLEYEKVNAKMGLLKMLSAKREEVPQKNEIALLSQVFGRQFDDIIKMHGGLGTTGNAKWEAVKDVANMQKSLMASIDMSALFRQGGGLMLEPSWKKGQIFRPAWKNNIIPMVKMFGKKDYYEAAQQAIKDDDFYLLSKEAGLKLTGLGQDPAHREEAFPSELAEKIPGVAASERAYVGFLNKARFDTFKSLIQDAKAQGLHPKDVMHEIANAVNILSGRGQLPGKMDRIASDLNAVFFSPRLMASRVQMMNPKTYIDASPFVRKQYLYGMLSTVAAGLTVTGLMSMLGAKTYTKLSDTKGDPLIPGVGGFNFKSGNPGRMHGLPYMPVDADFGKSRFGNTRIENYNGFLPYVTYMGRMLSGERESSTTGKMYILGKGFAAPNRLNITEDFLANKLGPAGSLVYKILKQKDPTGKPYNFSPSVLQSLQDLKNGNFKTALKHAQSGEVADTFIPMFIGDLISVLKDNPAHLPAAIPSFFGMGTQTYGKTPQKSSGGLSIRP